VIIVDTNIVMYAAGGAHPFKAPALRLLERVAGGAVAAAVNAEALQEILHRFQGSARWPDGLRMCALTRQIFPVVVPITEGVMDRALAVMQQYPALTARDAVHAATALAEGVRGLCSYDADFDQVLGLRRLLPDDV
jgi:predicted nucleic acid-binding protein